MSKRYKPSLQTKIATIQGWLNEIVDPSPPLTVTGKLDEPTKRALKVFQDKMGVPESGQLNKATWEAFGRYLGDRGALTRSLSSLPSNLARSVGGLVSGNPVGNMRYDRGIFFGEYMERFRGLDKYQMLGLDRVLGYIERDRSIRDHRWAAYMIATVKLETANTYRPIKEYG